MIRENEEDEHERGQQCASGENRRAAEDRAPAQALFDLRNICVKLFAETHGPLPTLAFSIQHSGGRGMFTAEALRR